MAFQVSPLSICLHVEGESGSDAVGRFSGTVLCVAMQDTDPLAGTATEVPGEPEGLSGWGSTFFLVADPDKPAPVWVAKNDVSSHHVK